MQQEQPPPSSAGAQPTSPEERMPPIDLSSRYGPNSSAIKNEKSHLMKQLRRIERKETIQDLQKEGRRVAEQLTNAATNYMDEIEDLKAQIGKLKLKLGVFKRENHLTYQNLFNR